jgi:C-terminal processing protease CtpA/Prc
MKRLYTKMGTALFVFVLFCVVTAYAQEHKEVYKVIKEKQGAWLGVSIQDITPELAKKKNLKSEDGAYVSSVVDDSPADSAGLKKGDVIVKIGTRTIEDADDLSKAVQKSKSGSSVAVEFIRKGDKKTIQVTLRKAPRQRTMTNVMTAPHNIEMFMMHGGGIAGLKLNDLNEQLAEYFEAPDKKGVLVEEVKEKSSAAKAGLKAGDILVKVGTSRVENLEQVIDALNDVEKGDKVDFEIIRKGVNKTVTVEIEESDLSHLNMGRPGRFMDRFHFEFPSVNLHNELDQLQIELDGLNHVLSPLHNDIQMKKELSEELKNRNENARRRNAVFRTI